MRLREGKTRVIVLLYCNTRVKGPNVTGFGAFSNPKKSQSSRIVGWKAQTGKLSLVSKPWEQMKN